MYEWIPCGEIQEEGGKCLFVFPVGIKPTISPRGEINRIYACVQAEKGDGWDGENLSLGGTSHPEGSKIEAKT